VHAEAIQALGDPELVAQARTNLAFSADSLADQRALLLESLDEQRASGAKRSIDWTLATLGMVSANLGEFSEGLRYREEALRISRSTGAKLRIQDSLYWLANGLAHLGELDRALALEDEGLALAREAGVPRTIPRHLALRGIILTRLGRLPDARTVLLESLRIVTAMSLPGMRTNALIALAEISVRLGEHAEADALLADLAANDWGDRGEVEALFLATTAELHAARRETAEANTAFRRAVARVPAESGYYHADVRRRFARFLIDQGRGREAREHIEWLLHYYRDPVARIRHEEAQAMLAECGALA